MYLCVRSIDYISVSLCDYIFGIFTTVVICVFHFIVDITLPTFICLIQKVSQLFTIFLTNFEDYFFSRHYAMHVMFIYNDLPGYGSPPNVIISTITIPKDQTSENIDIVVSRTTSGAVHLTATENGFSSRY